MGPRLLIFVVYFIACKGLNYAAVLSNTCNDKVQQVQSQVGVAASQSRFETNLATATIKATISSTISNINTQLGTLQNRANAVEAPNAELCKNKLQLDLAQVNRQAPKLCFPKAGINAINLKVNQLNRLKGDASVICDACAQLYPLPTQELNSCVDGKIDGIVNQAADLQVQISSEASALQDQAVQCAQNAESAQLEIINNASTNFDACVNAV